MKGSAGGKVAGTHGILAGVLRTPIPNWNAGVLNANGWFGLDFAVVRRELGSVDPCVSCCGWGRDFFLSLFFFALGEVAARLAVSPPSTYQTYNMADPKLRAEIAQGANLNSAETNDRSAPATGTPLEDVRVFVCALWKEQECHLTHHGLLCPSRTVFSLAMAL